MGLVAFFSKDLRTFRKRVDYIYQTHQEKINIKEKIALIPEQQKNEKRSKLTRKESKLIDVWGFCDGISLYQLPEKHKDVLGLQLHQSQSVKVAEFIESHKLQERGGLKKISEWDGCYTKSDLIDYLKALTINAKNSKRDI